MTTGGHVKTSLAMEEDIVLRLQRGHWRPGDQLPTEGQLAEQYGLCRSTVKKALSSLHGKGLIVSRRGKGHFVAEPPPRPRTWTIGVMLFASRHFNHPVTVSRLAGIQDALLNTPYSMKVLIQYDEHSLPPEWRPGMPVPESPIDFDSLDALVTHSAGFGEQRLREVSREVPICCTELFMPGLRLSHVRHDFAGGAAMALRRVMEFGHRRIALLRADVVMDGMLTLEGIRLGLLAHPDAVAVGFRHLDCLEHTEEAGAAAALEFLALPPSERPTVVLATYELAHGFVRAARERGLDVPRDISVVTLSSLPVSRPDGEPELSGIQLDHVRLGRVTGEEVLRLLGDPAAPGRIILPPVDWQDHGSLAPPPAMA